MQISYKIDATLGKENLCEIVMEIDDFPEKTMNVAIPAWVPGSYTLRDYATKVREFRAQTGSGELLQVKKRDKSTWVISGFNGDKVQVSYKLYTGDLIPQGNHINDDHTYLLGNSTFVYIEGYKEQSCELDLKVPNGARIITSLDEVNGNRYRATDYDVLADSIIEIGNPLVSEFNLEGKNHRIVFCGYDDVDLEKVTEDIRKIVETETDMFGNIPYRDYTFFVHVDQNSNGSGHEHRNSCSIVVGKALLGPHYTEFLNVVAHEFFHCYNVKRIKPAEFDSFDYSKENYTSLLWLSEGFTSYYAEVTLARSGIIDEKKYMERLAESVRLYELMPGRLDISASQSSFDTWIRQYRSSSDDLNTFMSYYTKGSMIGFAMNNSVIRNTGAEKSLDDVMRSLWKKFLKDGKGISASDVKNTLKETTGKDYSDFFEKYVDGTESIDFYSEFAFLGYTLSRKRSDGDLVESKNSTSGLIMRNEGGKFKVITPVRGYPSYGSGISPGDEVLSYNNIPFSAETFSPITTKWPSAPGTDLIKNISSGNHITLRVLRNERIREYDLETAETPYSSYEITKKEGSKQKKNIEKTIKG